MKCPRIDIQPHCRASAACLPILASALLLVFAFGCGDEGDPSALPSEPTSSSTGSGDMPDGTSGSGGDTATSTSDEQSARPGQPLIDAVDELRIGRYLGRDLDAQVEEARGAGNRLAWTFDPEDGPKCLRGAPWRFLTRDGESDDLLIFLQGGGACWSDFCLAVNEAPDHMPGIDILDSRIEGHPVGDWNVAYLPYCDGSLFLGDRDHDDSGDGEIDRFHRGLQNLSSALDLSRDRWPDPPRVLLAGSSGGGYGTIVAAALVRALWPDAELFVFNDSGVGVVNGEDPAFLARILDEFGIIDDLPPSCEACIDDGHVLRLVEWTLERDPSLRLALFSSWRDTIIADTFLQVGGDQFARELASETTRVHELFPEQMRRFFVAGGMHTTLLGDPTGIIGSSLTAVEVPPGFLSDLESIKIGGLEDTHIGELRVIDWLTAFVEKDDQVWVDILEDDVVPESDE